MIANLLVVSADDFPIQISRELEKTGFSTAFSRGVLKTREILDTQKMDAIIWLFMGHERALALDLLKIFNQHAGIPIILITQSYDELDFAEDIKGLFANIDLNDDIEDILQTIETACNQSIIIEETPLETDTHEIDFKNVMSTIIEGALVNDDTPETIAQFDVWDAVDRTEKKILSEKDEEKSRRLLPKLKPFWNRG